MAYLCTMLSRAASGRLKAKAWDHLLAHLLTCLVVDTGYQLGAS